MQRPWHRLEVSDLCDLCDLSLTKPNWRKERVLPARCLAIRSLGRDVDAVVFVVDDWMIGLAVSSEGCLGPVRLRCPAPWAVVLPSIFPHFNCGKIYKHRVRRRTNLPPVCEIHSNQVLGGNFLFWRIVMGIGCFLPNLSARLSDHLNIGAGFLLPWSLSWEMFDANSLWFANDWNILIPGKPYLIYRFRTNNAAVTHYPDNIVQYSADNNALLFLVTIGQINRGNGGFCTN